LLLVMFANVAARAVLNTDIAWNTEFGEFVLLWATFLGGASAMPRVLGHVTELGTRVGVIAILGLLIWHGVGITNSTMSQEMTVLHWPMGVQYLAMPAGSALALVFVLYETTLLARGEPIPQEVFLD
jgi:TRAP-type C4-dicarboxylate transport system permease small subunit